MVSLVTLITDMPVPQGLAGKTTAITTPIALIHHWHSMGC
jgi:hypothetical protein